ncbi:MAG: outer membrane protein assembly factor BamD [Chitinophagales bacterium]|nr:outer membrane protein assembly factor BamD [Chitinophagales bacterium]
MRKIFIILLSLSLFACNKSYQQALKSNDVDEKEKVANEYFEKEKYEKAIPLYEQLLTVLKGQKSVEDIYFKYAKAQYYNQSYELAGYYLRSFYQTYPASKNAEEAGFLEAKSYADVSPRYSLEQVNTIKAISVFNSFLTRYPDSKYKTEVNAEMDKLRGKLRKKSYEAAYLYYKIEQYHAASVALANFIEEYPEYEKPDEIAYLIVKSNFKYAEQSYSEKKLERFEEYATSYQDFVNKFPNSEYIGELNKLNQQALNKIKNTKKDKS